MSAWLAGLVFDSSIQQNRLFLSAAALVAFNTLVYLALTGSRMLWWFKPSRGLLLKASGASIRADSPAIADVLPPARRAPADDGHAPGHPDERGG